MRRSTNPDDAALLSQLRVEYLDDPPPKRGKIDHWVEAVVLLGDEQIGRLYFILKRRYAYEKEVQVATAYRRRGVASWLYRQVERDYGVKMVMDTDRTADGRAFLKGRRKNPAAPSRAPDPWLMSAYHHGKRCRERGLTIEECVYDPGCDEHWFYDEAASLFHEAGFRGEPIPRWVRGVRYGSIPQGERSINHATHDREKGLSVLFVCGERGDYDWRRCTVGGMFGTIRHRGAHVVEGWLHHRRGSDGEPLLVAPVLVREPRKPHGAKRTTSRRPNGTPAGEYVVQTRLGAFRILRVERDPDDPNSRAWPRTTWFVFWPGRQDPDEWANTLREARQIVNRAAK